MILYYINIYNYISNIDFYIYFNIMDGTEDLGTSVLTVRYKVVFVGDVSVGKTSIMNRFVNNEFTDKYDVRIIIVK